MLNTLSSKEIGTYIRENYSNTTPKYLKILEITQVMCFNSIIKRRSDRVICFFTDMGTSDIFFCRIYTYTIFYRKEKIHSKALIKIKLCL